jgi:adenylosuccinate lyase
MLRNLDATRGLIFSGQLLLDLTAAGMLREDAYRLVQSHAMRAWGSDGDFRSSIESDREISSYLPLRKLEAVFSLDRHLAHVDQIFSRVFQKSLYLTIT